MKPFKGSNASCGYLLLVVVILHLTVFPTSARGQAAQETLPNEPVKRGFESWSLFLVCNPAWLLAENQAMLLNLYDQFGAFGEVIGPKHLAVWFWKRPPGFYKRPPEEVADYVDAARSSLYCEKFKLKPSESPHIIVTTTYPDLHGAAGDHLVLKLNKLGSSDITALLSKLSDQILVEELDQATLDSEQYWRAWQRTFEAVRGGLARFIKNVKLTIDTRFLKLEIEGGTTSDVR